MEPGNGNIILYTNIIAMSIFIVLISHHHCLLTIEDNKPPKYYCHCVIDIIALIENVSYEDIVIVLRL